MSALIPPPRPMVCTGDTFHNFTCFREAYEDFALATELTLKSDAIQMATLRSTMGEDCRRILRRLKPPSVPGTPTTALPNPPTIVGFSTAKSILDVLEAYFSPKKNLLYERYKFLSAVQQQSENVDQYYIRLRHLAASCQYPAEDETVRDSLVLGCKDKLARARLFQASKVSLDEVLHSLRISESSQAQLQVIDGPTNTDSVNKITYNNKSHIEGLLHQQSSSDRREVHRDRKDFQASTNSTPRTSNLQSQGISCYKCGGAHSRRQPCPAYGQTCGFCGFRNHYSKVCRKQQQQQSVHYLQNAIISHNSEQKADDSSDELLIIEDVGQVKIIPPPTKYYETICIHNVDLSEKRLLCQLDTGATCNIISFTDLCAITQTHEPELRPSASKLRMFNGSTSTPLGECTLTCSTGNARKELNFKVMSGHHPALLGASSCVELGLITFHPLNHVTSSMKKTAYENCQLGKADASLDKAKISAQAVLNRYPDVFQGLC